MTDFERSLLTSAVIMSYYTTQKSKRILKELEAEETTHIGDEFESRVIQNISNYVKDFIEDDTRREEWINSKIQPQLDVGNYINIITEIEALEYRYLAK